MACKSSESERQMLSVSGEIADFAYKQGVGEAVAVDRLIMEYRRVAAERDRIRRLFTRLDGAITHHKAADRFKDDHDAALYKARAKVTSDYAEGNG